MENQANLFNEVIEEQEIWKDVIGHEGFYQVSSVGNIKALERLVKNKSGGFHLKKSMPMKLSDDKDGYKIIIFNNNGITKRTSVHRVMAFAFIPNPENKTSVNHINGIKWDNRLSNLEWCTISENGIHAHRVLKIKHPAKGKFGSDNPSARGIIQYSKDMVELNRFGSRRDAQEATGVNKSTINECLNGRLKTAGGFVWIKLKYIETNGQAKV